MKIGFIGLGIMGKPMSKNLLKKDYSVMVYDLNADAVAEVVACGGTQAASIAQVAENDIIFTMLPDSPQVEAVVLGAGGVIESIKPGSIVVDMSSIDPNVSIKVASALAEKGVEMIDAPVSGGEPKAIDASLSFMCGGKQEVFDKVTDLLACMGSSVVLVGDIGSGNVTKLANQIMVAANIAGMAEALALAKRMGVSQSKVFDAVKGGLAGSTVLNAKAPMILEDNYNPGFRIQLHIKDLKNAINACKMVDMASPCSDLAMEIFENVSEQGYLQADHCAMIHYYNQQEK